MEYDKIKGLLSRKHRKSLRNFFFQCLGLNFLDLLSLAYLIPIIALLLDKQKFQALAQQYGFGFIEFNEQLILIGIGFLFLFYFVKNLLHINYNNRFIHYLYDLSNEIALKNVEAYLSQGHLNHQAQDKGNVFSLVIKVSKDFCCRYLQPFIYLLGEVCFLLVVMCCLLFFYFKFTLLLVSILCLFFLLIYWNKQSQMQLINSTYKESLAAANSELMNILDGYLEIKSSNNEQFFMNTFYQKLSKLNEVTALLESATVNYSKYLELCLIASLGSFAYFSFSLGDNNLLLISTFAALGLRFIPSLSRILGALTKIRAHSFSIDVLDSQFRFLEQQAKKSITSFTHSLELQDISFCYEPNKPIFSAINFKIKAGDFVSINGISGVGKTTFLHVLMGLLSPTSGKILVDGKSVHNYHLFNFLNYVPQHPYLFSGTVMDNITMGQTAESGDQAYINQLCDIFHLTDVIAQLPHQFNTYLQHNSTRLSGGQKQRLALVRALYKRPKILILDEATNQQDETLEAAIFRFLKQLSIDEQMAIISVSHNTALNSFSNTTFLLAGQQFNLA